MVDGILMVLNVISCLKIQIYIVKWKKNHMWTQNKVIFIPGKYSHENRLSNIIPKTTINRGKLELLVVVVLGSYKLVVLSHHV